MSVRLVQFSDTFQRLLNDAAAEGITRCTSQYASYAKQTVGISNPGRNISASLLRAQAKAQLGRRSKGLVTIQSKTKDGQIFKSTIWFDQKLDNNKRTARIYPFSSKPGEPPRKRTGAGQRGIQFEVDRSVPAGRVGVLPHVKYMVYLNFGTRLIAARPWIDLTLRRHQSELELLLRTGASSVLN